MVVRILAASDRNNYGDLLFPILIKKYLERRDNTYKIMNYGIVKSNLEYFGALKTQSFNDLVNDSKNSTDNSIIVIGGGEVIGGGWLNILRFINSFWNSIYHNRYIRFTINKFKILESLMSVKFSSSRPFILDGKDFSRKKIYYNSVGAQGASKLLSKKLNIQKYFREVKYVSVRDHQSKEIFDKHQIESYLVPDSALIMSDLVSDEFGNFVTPKCVELIKDEYLFVQLGNNKGPNNLKEFLSNLGDFANQNSLKVVLCPIGLALDHGDDILLKSIHQNHPEFTYYHPENLYEIMYLLKNTKLYLGTSLHGMITAQSFNVPFFIFPEKISKLKKYIDTWFENPKLLYGDFNDFSKVRHRLISFNQEKELHVLKSQKELIYQSFQRIFSDDK